MTSPFIVIVSSSETVSIKMWLFVVKILYITLLIVLFADHCGQCLKHRDFNLENPGSNRGLSNFGQVYLLYINPVHSAVFVNTWL